MGLENRTANVAHNVEYFNLLEEATGSEPIETDFGINESAFSQGYFDKFFIIQSTLGRGSRGTVYLVEHILDKVSLGLFALKKVPVGDNHEWLEKVLAEVHLLRLLTHPNLVSYNHVWLEISSVSSFAPQVPCAFILQEYCNGGTLEDYIRAKASTGGPIPKTRKERLRRESGNGYRPEILTDYQRLTLDEIITFMIDIVTGVAYLHQNKIIHRDLKPSNCLLRVSPVGDLPTVLVSDFGEGQLEGTKRGGTGCTGTLEYCAPELVTSRLGRLAQFSKETDIFSLGMILYYLCFSKLPYSANVWDDLEDVEQLKIKICEFQGYEYNESDRANLPHELHQLLVKCLDINPTKRPTGDQILSVLRSLRGDEPNNNININTTSNNNNHNHNEQTFTTPENSNTTSQLALLPQPPHDQFFEPFDNNEGVSPRKFHICTPVKLAIIASELAITIFMKPSTLTQLAVLILGCQIPTTNSKYMLYLIVAFLALSMYTTI